VKAGVGLEKVRFSQNSKNFGDREYLPEAPTSLVGLPKRKVFLITFLGMTFSTPTGVYIFNPVVTSD
jgi:hypothetical protein